MDRDFCTYISQVNGHRVHYVCNMKLPSRALFRVFGGSVDLIKLKSVSTGMN